MIVDSIARDEVARGGERSLAAAYVEDYASVADFYVDGWQGLDGVQEYGDSLYSAGRFSHIDRVGLAETLVAAMQPLGASPHSIANAKSLTNERTLCVVTGQQACLAGGPLFVLAKVAHAIALAKELSASGQPCVPIFWCASEDHDLDEANLFTALDSKRKLKKVRAAGLDGEQGVALEYLKVPQFSDKSIQEIAKLLPEGDALDEALELLELGSGLVFGEALNRILLRLFAEDGLVTLEARHLRRFAGFQDVVGQELQDPRQIAGLLGRKSFEVDEAGFDSILQVREYLSTFLMVEAKRRHLYFDGRGIDVVDEVRNFSSREEALEDLYARPDVYSTGVALRPVVQQATLPCVAYVAGPGEIAYHALVTGLCEEMGYAPPLLIPRWSFVLDDQNADFGAMRDTALESAAAAGRAAASAAEAGLEIRAELRQTKDGLGTLAGVVEHDFERLEGRVDKTLKELRGRLTADPLARVGVSDDARAALATTMPKLQPQERELSWLALWPEWSATLREAFAEKSAFDFSQSVLRRS